MKKLLLLVFLFTTSQAFPQWLPEFMYTSPLLQEKDNNRLTLDADAVGFFKNNEYFSPLSKGQTFPGIRFEPTVGFQIENKLRFELGLVGVYFSGHQKKDDLSVFNNLFARIQYAVRPNLNLVFGNLYGGANHRLVEPLYKWERQLIERPESGLQVIYNNDRYFADIWVDWRRYIEHGDSVPEILNFGLSAAAKLSAEESNFQLSIPFQLMIYHKGGQIDTSDEKMIIVGNAATGVNMKWKLNNRLIRSVDFDMFLMGYYDKLPDKDMRPYNRGWGIYPVVTLNAKYIKFMTGYWYGHKFYSFDGDPLFSSFNLMYPEEVHAYRNLLTNKISYFKQLHKSFSIGAQVESYYDIKLKQFDYSFGINLRLNAQLFSKLF